MRSTACCLSADKPQFLASPTGVAAVIESGTLVLNATAVGNPMDISYQWTYTPRSDDNVAITDCTAAINMSSTVVIVPPRSGPRLVISDVTRSNSGTYCSSAQNAEGSTLLPFIIDVQCELLSVVCLYVKLGFRFENQTCRLRTLWRTREQVKTQKMTATLDEMCYSNITDTLVADRFVLLLYFCETYLYCMLFDKDRCSSEDQR